MVGARNPFDAICDEAGVVGDDERDWLFKELTGPKRVLRRPALDLRGADYACV
jgi:hypothetical protein